MNRSDATVAAGALELDVLVEEPAWTGTLPDAPALCQVAAEAAFLRVAGFGNGYSGGAAEACLLLSTDAQIRQLNRQFRGHDRPTDVLSFPSGGPEERPDIGEQPVVLGDIIIAYETAIADAMRDGKTFGDHLRHLVVHAMLHLMGYDHESEAEAAEMETLEIDILAALGVANPYASVSEATT